MEKETLEKDIMRLLEKHPDISTKEIANQLAIPEEVVLANIKRLSDTRPKILVIDDEQDTVIAVKRALEADGYNVLEASNGARGLEVVKSDTPDVIILDLMMPEMDGFTVCRKLKSESDYMHIPVIMLTAKKVTTDDKIEGLEIGADDYITKPFSLKELRARIKAVIRRGQR